MNDRNYTVCLNKDLKQSEFRYKKLEHYENLLLELIDNLLETVTILPICKNEYKNDSKKFEKYDKSYELLFDLLRLFEYYGVSIDNPFEMKTPTDSLG